MTIEQMHNIIDFEMQNGNDDTVCFGFFGGEPFLAFDLIKDGITYLKSGNWQKKWRCITTTNGTMVHGEVQEFIVANRDVFSVFLSYDGTPAMQDVNRSKSASRIDLPFFKKLYSTGNTHALKMTISPESLPNLYDGITFLESKGFIVHANFAQGINWTRANAETFRQQLDLVINHYLEHPDLPPSNLIDLPIVYLREKESSIRKYCGAGSKMFTYYLDGKRYPCQFFTPMSIGIERAKQFEGKAFEEGIIIDLLDQKCQDCPAVSICPTCIGTNMASFGNLYAKDDGYCRLLKYQFVATSYFKWEQIKRGVLEINNEQKWRLLKAIYRIQSEMRIE